MAHFYAEIQGNRGPVSRCGSPNSGVWTHVRGWNVGAFVTITRENDLDVVRVHRTKGSNGGGLTLLTQFVEGDDVGNPNIPPPINNWTGTQLALPGVTPPDPTRPEDLTREELIDLVHAMRQDWETLNEKHNKRADAEAWCPVYESNQLLYNHDFKVLKLKGRPGTQGRDDLRWPGRYGNQDPL